MSSQLSNLTLNDVYVKLSERVSAYNARLLITTVRVGTGIREASDAPLNEEDARNVCLELIKKGGPAFQVGKDLYSQLQ